MNSILTEQGASLTEEKLFFIGGSPRSGTTLVQRILGAHPDVYAGPEFDLIPPIIELYDKTIERIHNGRIHRILQPKQAKVAFGSLILDLLKDKAAAEHATYFCEKTPSNSLVFSQLNSILPNSKLVLVLRNPIDIYHSMLAVANRHIQAGEAAPKNIRGAAERFKTIGDHQSFGLNAYEKGGNVHVLYYEDIIEAPAKAITKLCDFLCIDFDHKMIDIKGKRIETPDNDNQLWYDNADLGAGIQQAPSAHAQNINGYLHFLYNKYIPHQHSSMSRYHYNERSSALKNIYHLREYLSSNSKHRRFLRKGNRA